MSAEHHRLSKLGHKMVIWVVNPFDQLPNETDVPLRYWALCRTFAEQGHHVVWWSSDFSHLTKSKRKPCSFIDGFSVRLVESPPYTKNISRARLKNHKAFAEGFYRDAMKDLKSGELKVPDRIVISLPPLGVAEQAFKIRDFVNANTQLQREGDRSQRSKSRSQTDYQAHRTSNEQLTTTQSPCEVVVDIMDAWPETFYQALPKSLRKILGPILLAPMHCSAKRAYQGADKITAVGQSYLDLASLYLGQKCKVESGKGKNNRIHNTLITTHNSSAKPMHLCYHGTDLSRFTPPPQSVITHSPSLNTPLRAVYLGAMGTGYDLQTIIDVAASWKAAGNFPFQIHFAGDGPQREALEAKCEALKLLVGDNSDNHEPEIRKKEFRVVFHGFLQKDAINDLLLSADLALVANLPDSLVACPYKAGEYAAAGLPIISCLRGELGDLLNQWDAGSEYNEGDVDSLDTAFKGYLDNVELLKEQSLNARKMAKTLFNRSRSYAQLVDFINSSSRD